MLAKAEKYMLDAAPVIPLMTRATDWMKKPYVKGMYPNPGTLHAWKFVYIERDQNKWTGSMDDIMTAEDPQFDTQLKTLMATQEEAQKAKQAQPQTETTEKTKTAKAE